MCDDLNVASLLRAISNGDESALDTLKNEYSLMSEAGFAFFFKLSPRASESLAQQTFLAAQERLRTTPVDGSFFRFLCDTARQILDDHPSADRESAVPLPEPPLEPITPEDFEILFLHEIERLREPHISDWLGIRPEEVARVLRPFRRRPPS